MLSESTEIEKSPPKSLSIERAFFNAISCVTYLSINNSLVVNNRSSSCNSKNSKNLGLFVEVMPAQYLNSAIGLYLYDFS